MKPTLADDLIAKLAEHVTQKFAAYDRLAFLSGASGNPEALAVANLSPESVGIHYAAGRAFAQLIRDNMPTRTWLAVTLAGRAAVVDALVKSMTPLLLAAVAGSYSKARKGLEAVNA